MIFIGFYFKKIKKKIRHFISIYTKLYSVLLLIFEKCVFLMIKIENKLGPSCAKLRLNWAGTLRLPLIIIGPSGLHALSQN